MNMDVYMRGQSLTFERRCSVYFLIDDDKYMDYNNIRYFNFEYINNAIRLDLNEQQFDYVFSHVKDYDLKIARYSIIHFNMLDNYKVEEAWTKVCKLRPHLRTTVFERKNPFPYALWIDRS